MVKKCLKKEIKINFDSLDSMKKGERTKKNLEKKGYILEKTKQEGFNKFILKYKKC